MFRKCVELTNESLYDVGLADFRQPDQLVAGKGTISTYNDCSRPANDEWPHRGSFGGRRTNPLVRDGPRVPCGYCASHSGHYGDRCDGSYSKYSSHSWKASSERETWQRPDADRYNPPPAVGCHHSLANGCGLASVAAPCYVDEATDRFVFLGACEDVPFVARHQVFFFALHHLD